MIGSDAQLSLGFMFTPMREDDRAARHAVEHDLDVNLLVEAGAGSGKTTSLVRRMTALIRRGTPMHEIAAVTFTRRAANELRERFKEEIEKALVTARAKAPDGSDGRAREELERLERALRDIGQAFIGTIHAFCGRLLRERPVEAILDPAFVELPGEEWEMVCADFWRRWSEREWIGGQSLAQLHAIGVRAKELESAFTEIAGNPDVRFAFAPSAPPEFADCKWKLERLLDRAWAMMPTEEPEGGWDALMSLVRRLYAHAARKPWVDVAAFCDALELISEKTCKTTQYRWSSEKEGKEAAKALSQEFLDLLQSDIEAVLRCWREHRYPIVMDVLLRAARDFERERVETGRLSFGDLLMRAAALLRDHPTARDALGRRFPRLLVDEFQDTDPVQAEVCFLISSPSSDGNNWRRVTPRPGALFVVGDPKQSIYRFRRADIAVYDLVKSRIEASGGRTLALTANFRSVHPIGELVNHHFGRVFPESSTGMQAAFSPLVTQNAASAGDGLFDYVVTGVDKAGKVVPEDADRLASYITAQIADGLASAGDFLILVNRRKEIEPYASALGARNVPVTTTGAPLHQELELQELVVVLRALADPDNAVLVAAALEGLFVGCTPIDLFDARRANVRFAISHPPADRSTRAGQGLARLHAWWAHSQHERADVLVERILDETGLLAYAASGDLGDANAGALLHLVDMLRDSAVGASSLARATEAIDALLTREVSDTPLRPGREDAVRVMNLHNAKGLESDIVVLAAPVARKEHPVDLHVARGAGDDAVGSMQISNTVNRQKRLIAQPPGWDELAATEQEMLAAERERQLYVATTRARKRLIIARSEWDVPNGKDIPAWGSLASSLAEIGTVRRLEMPIVAAPGRREPELTEEIIAERVAALNERRAHSRAEVTKSRAVTQSAKVEKSDRREFDLPLEVDDPDTIGRSQVPWGRAVHRVIEGRIRGRSGEALRRFARAVGLDEDLDAKQVAALQLLVSRLHESSVWARLRGAQAEVPIMRLTTSEDGLTQIVEGVIDALGRSADGWQVVDWKTAGSGRAFESARPRYERQVNEYAEILHALTGDRANGELVRVR